MLNVEIHGSQVRCDAISADPGSEWSWILEPPRFYVRSVPAVVDESTGTALARIAFDDLRDYAVAVYLLEHNDVDDVALTLADGEAIDVAGRVFLFDRWRDFKIAWTASERGATAGRLQGLR